MVSSHDDRALTVTFRTTLPSPETVSPCQCDVSKLTFLGLTRAFAFDSARMPLAPVFVASGFSSSWTTGAEAADEPTRPVLSRPLTVAIASMAATAALRRPLPAPLGQDP